MTDLRKIIIDDTELEVPGALTVLQACEQAGVEIPRFCYHERLSIAGNCRMCLVEVVGGPPKPIASCASQVCDLRPGSEGTPPRIRTNTAMVKKAREGVMEFLLINHPLDCPICDQGGECDLQDQAMAYGTDFSRFREHKRSIIDPDLGPLVQTHMTRCISCTRCVRFTTEVAGTDQMGQTGRGEDAEITSYLSQTLVSNLQGNIIDLCPVGALVSKPYAFTARPWELTRTQTIDVMDALGSNIRVDTKGPRVMRILPREHDGVNEEWISDKTRFVWDGLRRQRLDQPYIRVDGRLQPATWPHALATAAQRLARAAYPVAIVGDLVSTETAYAARALVAGLGGGAECRVDGAHLPAANRLGYVGNARVECLDTARRVLLVGTDPRNEAPVLNARIRKAWTRGAEVDVIGPPVDLTYPYRHVGSGRAALQAMVERCTSGRGAAGEPGGDGPGVLIVGQGALRGSDGASVLAAAMRLAQVLRLETMVLHTAIARVGAMDVGCTIDGGLGAVSTADVVYNLGADEEEADTAIGAGAFVIYQGSHGDRGAHRADVVLPGAAYTEEDGLFVNTEGRPQRALRAVFPPGAAKENWAIVRALSGALNAALPFDTLGQLRAQMVRAHPHLGLIDEVPDNTGDLPQADGPLGAGDFKPAIADFYLTNPIARASGVMAELSRQARARAAPPVAAE